MTDLETFKRAYIEAMLRSSTDDDDEPLDTKYDYRDLAPSAVNQIDDDCAEFYLAHHEAIDATWNHSRPAAYAGHDFWLTRNGHGAGFWDGGWPEPLGAQLTEASKKFGPCDPYVGDDGLIYLA